MRVLLVNDTDGRDNVGCQLTSRTFSGLLRQQGFDVVSAPWRFANHLKAGDRQLWSGFGADRLLSAQTLLMLAKVEYGDSAVAAAREADLVVFQPEGTISDHHTALRILRNLSLPMWCALHGNRPVVVANGTFPPFSDERAAPIRQLLRAADLAALRDRISARHWDVACAPDSAVLWDGAPVQAGADRLLITTAAECPPEVDHAIGEAALRICASTGLRPLVLTKAWQRFEPLRARIEAAGGTFATQSSLDEADAAFAACRLHVGGRYHMALLCATKGIPSAIVRSNTHKNLWLAAEFAGVVLAESANHLPDAVARLPAAVPHTPLLADIARCRAETLQVLGRLGEVWRSAKDPMPLPEPFVAQVRREARRDRWRAAIRQLTGRA
jgi:hypothetical protein